MNEETTQSEPQREFNQGRTATGPISSEPKPVVPEPPPTPVEDVEDSRAKVVESEGVDAGTGEQGTGQSVEVDQVAPTGNEE